ncbi:MAG: hypothetical protein GY869_11575, partial [Planctomycetes bacterium]|nr:hypothetical protein [Planctomycetota bacterium]
MFTIEHIFQRLLNGAPGTLRGVGFREPVNGPIFGTGHTLNEVMGLAPALDDLSGAAPDQVLLNQTYWGLTSGAWGLTTGTMPDIGRQDFMPGLTPQTVLQGYHDGSGQVAGDSDLIPANIRNNVNIFNVTGTAFISVGNVNASQVLLGRVFSNDTGSGLSGTMPNIGQQNSTPGIADQPISLGYHDGNGTVFGDPEL